MTATDPNHPPQAGTAQPLFFEQATALDAGRHRNLRLKQADGFAFAAKANALPVTLPELSAVCVEYPVVFIDEGRGPFPVAVVGLRPDQNLFVGRAGRWQARYVPAYARMYPFILAQAPGDQQTLTVCFDAGYDGFNEKEGEPLFHDDGGQSDLLQRAVAFLREFHVQRERTVAAAAMLAQAGLLTPMHANVQLRSREALSLAGFLTLDTERFDTLSDDAKGRLVSSGALEMVHLHRASLQVFDRLVERLARRDAGAKKTTPKGKSGSRRSRHESASLQ